MNYWERWTPGERLAVALFACGLLAFVTATAVKRWPTSPPSIKFVEAPAQASPPLGAAPQPAVTAPPPNTVEKAPAPAQPQEQDVEKAQPRIEAPASATEEPSKESKPAKGATLNVNTATAAELAASLPGIGPVIAQRIVEYRNLHGKFTASEQLVEVKGIGPKKLEKIRPFLTF